MSASGAQAPYCERVDTFVDTAVRLSMIGLRALTPKLNAVRTITVVAAVHLCLLSNANRGDSRAVDRESTCMRPGSVCRCTAAALKARRGIGRIERLGDHRTRKPRC